MVAKVTNDVELQCNINEGYHTERLKETFLEIPLSQSISCVRQFKQSIKHKQGFKFDQKTKRTKRWGENTECLL